MSAAGDVTAVEVAEHAGDPFDDAALAAAREWKFTPALRNGIAQHSVRPNSG